MQFLHFLMHKASKIWIATKFGVIIDKALAVLFTENWHILQTHEQYP